MTAYFFAFFTVIIKYYISRLSEKDVRLMRGEWNPWM